MIVSLALLTEAGMALSSIKYAAERLDDAALDRVTAGGVSAGISDGVVKFDGSVPTPNGPVTGVGAR